MILRLTLTLSITIFSFAPQVGAEQPSAAPAAPASAVSFRNFAGYCQGNTSPLLTPFVGWDRHDIAWDHLQPKPDEWKQDYLEKWGQRILKVHVAGQKFLPVLAYNAPWSWDRAARDYEFGDTRHEIRPRDDGQFDVRTLKRAKGQANEGKWIEEKVEVKTGNARWPLAERHIKDWENYVRKVVSFLRAAPYNVKYFQIWNEAHPDSGFWDGDLDTYMKRVHLPAAKVIRELDGKVVYGGWPVCGTLQTYTSMLDRHDAWKTIDVHDVHYFGIGAFDFLHKAAMQRGIPSPNLWQTEIGFISNKSFISNNYPRFLHWCLSHGWSQPDQYKLFFFACWTPNDPKSYGYNKSLLHGEQLSPHGQSLVTLAKLLEGSYLRLYNEVTTEPSLTEKGDGRSGLEAFRVGDRIVIALHLAPDSEGNGKRDDTKIRLLFPKLEAAHLTQAARVDPAGLRQELSASPAGAGSGIVLDVPLQDAPDSPVKSWLKEDQVPTFFVELKLK